MALYILGMLIYTYRQFTSDQAKEIVALEYPKEVVCLACLLLSLLWPLCLVQEILFKESRLKFTEGGV